MSQTKPPTAGSLLWVYLPLFLIALALFGVGVYLAARGLSWALLAAGATSVVAVVAAWPVAVALAQLSDLTGLRIEEQVLPVRQRLDQISHRLNKLGEQQLLSDRAKAIAFRANDRQALRDAIREDIDKQDWEAALRLADDMDKIFGYRQEAATVRKDVLARRDDLQRRQIGDGINTVHRRCEEEDWPEAYEEAERLRRMFPGEPRVERLRADIDRRREELRDRLLGDWHQLVDAGENDKAIALLRRMDPYLTPAEGEELREKAKRMFKGRLDDLRGRFTSAAREGRWDEALRIGSMIRQEYPNSLIAREVSDMAPTLEARRDGRPEPDRAAAPAAPPTPIPANGQAQPAAT